MLTLSTLLDSDIGIYPIILTMSLVDYTSITTTIEFSAVISPCEIISITATSSPANVVYIVGDVAQTFGLGSYVQTPMCGYSVTY